MTSTNSLADVEAMIDEFDALAPNDKRQALEAWSLALTASSFQRAIDCPFTPGSEPYTLVEHTHAVTRASLALAGVVEALHGAKVDRKALILAALTHDTGKLVETEIEGKQSRKSPIGEAVPHGFYSGHYAIQAGLPEEVVHLVVTHTPLSAVAPRTQEGLLLRYADLACADTVRLATGLELNIEKYRA
jgi:hypothetical protein